MQNDIISIEVYDKRQGVITSMYVEPLADNLFRAVENEIVNCSITLGTEFQTRINKEGQHEIIKITKASDYITRRFSLSTAFTESDYRLLGDEIIKHGGFWQVDFGSMATINLPPGCPLDLDEIFRVFNISPAEIKD